MAEQTQQSAAVYVSWGTFEGILKQLVVGIPNVIDRSVFPGQSWAVQSQILAGMRFLGLIDEAGRPKPDLAALAVSDEHARKEKLRALLKERYAHLFALDLTKATPDQLDKAMTEHYAVNGDTREKAVRFFLGAVGYAGVPISPLFKPKGASNGGSGSPARRRRNSSPRPKADDREPEGNGAASPTPPTTGTSRTIELKSGAGSVTVLANVDMFKLTGEERTFIFGLIDSLTKYGGADQ